MRRSRFAVAVALASLLAGLPLSRTSLAADEDLDPSFGEDGRVVTAVGTIHDVARGIVIQPDGKIVVAGSVRILDEADFAVARYNPDGTLDPTFSGDGIATTDFGIQGAYAYGVAPQPDGRIVATGYAYEAFNANVALARYNPDGTPDPTFEGDGKLTFDLGGGDYPTAVALQPDGKIVVSGETSASGADFDLFVARFSAEGAPDLTFDGDGWAPANFGGEDYGGGVAIQSDGKIVAAGRTEAGDGGDFAIARFDADGSLDDTFGPDGNGMVTTTFGPGPDEAYGVAIHSDGTIVAAGWGTIYGDFALARYTVGGNPDPTFDGDGKATVGLDGADFGRAVAIDPVTGRIVAAGSSIAPDMVERFAVVRLEPDGTLDPTFSADGKTTTSFGPGPDEALGVAIQADGKIVAAGSADNGANDDFALARYATPQLTLVATPGHVWANGRRKAVLTATLLDMAGDPWAGVDIMLSASPSQGVMIGPPATKTTDAAGQATFEATSTKIDDDFSARDVTFTASVVGQPHTLATAMVTFEPRKIVVQMLGVDTTLTCKPGGKCTAERDTFVEIRERLVESRGFKSKDFVWYSYKRGRVDASTGLWRPNNYGPTDTAQRYWRSISALHHLLDEFGTDNPNTEFYLVAHSQGGLIAFQALALLDELPPKTRVVAIFTLDSPLGGSPRPHVEFAQWVTDWDGPANEQLIKLYESASNHGRQGATATVLCRLVDYCTELALGTTNQQLRAAHPEVTVVTFGNLDDAVYTPRKCSIVGYYGVPNATSQVLRPGDLESLGGNWPTPPTISTIPGTLKAPFVLTACITNSHHRVSERKPWPIAYGVGDQHPG